MNSKAVIKDKVVKDSNSKKKFKIKAHKRKEVDIEIEVVEDGNYEVEKLSVDGLPETIDGHPITWLNNFAIKKKAGDYINQRYKIKIPGLGNKRVVILDNNSHGNPYFYTGPVENDTFELSDGDPAVGHT